MQPKPANSIHLLNVALLLRIYSFHCGFVLNSLLTIDRRISSKTIQMRTHRLHSIPNMDVGAKLPRMDCT